MRSMLCGLAFGVVALAFAAPASAQDRFVEGAGGIVLLEGEVILPLANGCNVVLLGTQMSQASLNTIRTTIAQGSWSGQCLNGLVHGKGRITNPSGAVADVEYHHGRGLIADTAMRARVDEAFRLTRMVQAGYVLNPTPQQLDAWGADVVNYCAPEVRNLFWASKTPDAAGNWIAIIEITLNEAFQLTIEDYREFNSPQRRQAEANLPSSRQNPQLWNAVESWNQCIYSRAIQLRFPGEADAGGPAFTVPSMAESWRWVGTGGQGERRAALLVDAASVIRTGDSIRFREMYVWQAYAADRNYDVLISESEGDCIRKLSGTGSNRKAFANGELIATAVTPSEMNHRPPNTLGRDALDAVCGDAAYRSDRLTSPEAYARERLMNN